LLSHAELLAAITVEKLAALLPREELGAIIASSLRQAEKYTEENLIAAVPPRTLVDHLPLDYVWSRVVSPLIAERHDYAPRGGGAVRSELPSGEENSSWSLAPSPESSALNIEAYTGGDGDIVTADDIIEEDALESGDTSGSSKGKKGSDSRKSARSA
jgi:hypothetical protein